MKIKYLCIWLFLLANYSFGQTNGKIKLKSKGDKWGVVNSTGKLIVPIMYDEVKVYDDGYITATLNKEIEIYKFTGTKISTPKYKRVGQVKSNPKSLFTDKSCQVCIDFNDGCGLIDNNGSVTLPLDYKHVGDFSDGMAFLHKNKKRGYVDTRGNVVVPFIYDWGIDNYQDGFVKVQLSGKEGFLDKTGKVIVPIEYTPNDYNYFSTSHNGLFAVNKNNKWGFVDSKGNETIPLSYDFVWGFKDGLAAVKKNGKWGFINKDNKLIIPTDYDGPTYPEFHEGIAAVEIGGKTGFIDKANRPITDFKYYNDLCSQSHYRDIHTYYKFKDGIALIKDKECKIGVINRQGQEIVPMKYSRVWMEDNGKIIAKEGSKEVVYKK